MKIISSLFAVAMLTAIQPVQAATTDPLRIIYRIAGVRDNGGVTHSGIATSFHCSSFSNVNERIRFIVRNASGAVVADVSPTVGGNDTYTVSTHLTNVFGDAAIASFDVIQQGSAVIQSTTLNMTCSAMIVDAATTVPQGIALHMQRFNPLDNTQE